MDTVTLTRTAITGTNTNQSYQVCTYTIPPTNGSCRFELDGWQDTAGKCGVHKVVLKINGKLIDSQSTFADKPVNSLSLLENQYLKMFALIYSVVTVDVIADSTVSGTFIMSSYPYDSKFDKRSGIVYDDLFTNGNRIPCKIHYQEGQAIVYTKNGTGWKQ